MMPKEQQEVTNLELLSLKILGVVWLAILTLKTLVSLFQITNTCYLYDLGEAQRFQRDPFIPNALRRVYFIVADRPISKRHYQIPNASSLVPEQT